MSDKSSGARVSIIGSGLGRPSISVLARLTFAEMTTRELADEEGVPFAVMNRRVLALQRRGFIDGDGMRWVRC